MTSSNLQSRKSLQKRTCSKHQNRDYLFICSHRNRSDAVFKCDFCVCQSSLAGQHLIPIQQIQQSEDKTIFWNWPFQNDPEIVKKLEVVAKKEKDEQKHISEIKVFFQKLKNQVMVKIDEIQEKMEKKAANLNNYQDEIISQYNILCKKQELKKAALDTSSEQELLSAEIKKIVEQVLDNKEFIKQTLETKIDEMKIQENSINYEIPNQLAEEIISSIEQIDMFMIDPEKIVASALPPEYKTSAKSNIDTIMELVSNKFNFVSLTFENHLRQQMEKYQKLFNSIQLLPNQEEQYQKLNINILEDNELEEALRFVETLIHSKCQEEKQMNKKNKRGIQVENIMKLLENKMNFISPSFRQIVTEKLEGIKSYLNCFQVDEIYQEGAQQITFEMLTFQEASKLQEIAPSIANLLKPDQSTKLQIQELVQIALKMEEGTKIQNKQRWNAENIFALISNSSNMCTQNQLSQLKSILSGVRSYLESHELIGNTPSPINWEGIDKEFLTHLEGLGKNLLDIQGDQSNKISPRIQFEDQSILEKLVEKISFILESQNHKVSTNINWELIKTGYKSSSQLIISPIQSGQCIFQELDLYSSAITNRLLNNKSIYSVTCIFNKPPTCTSISIGLIQNSRVNSDYVGQINDKSVYFNSRGGKEIIRGKCLSEINNEYTTLLFRFCIDTQEFYFADQSLKNINKVNSNLIDKNGEYRFGVSFRTPGTNWSVSVKDVKEIKADNL